MIRNIASATLITVLFSLRTAAAEPELIARSEWIMGTRCEVKIRPTAGVDSHASLESAFRIFRQIDELMSPYKEESEISRLNREAADHPFRVSRETFFVIRRALRFSKETNGAFDITIHPLIQTWGFFDLKGHIPPQDEISERLELVDWQAVLLNPGAQTVRFKKPGMALDLGGIAKGYAVDEATRELKRAGIENALINVGGTFYAFGESRENAPWAVGIRDPRDPNRTIRTLTLKEKAVATSGDYERYFDKRGEHYHHILDPSTGRPARGVAAVTVVAPFALEADALSTALFVMGEKEGRIFLESRPDIEAYFIPAD